MSAGDVNEIAAEGPVDGLACGRHSDRSGARGYRVLGRSVTPRRGSRRRGQVAAPGAGSYRFVIMRGCLRSEAALGMPLDELLATNVAQYQVWILRLQALARKVA